MRKRPLPGQIGRWAPFASIRPLLRNRRTNCRPHTPARSVLSSPTSARGTSLPIPGNGPATSAELVSSAAQDGAVGPSLTLLRALRCHTRERRRAFAACRRSRRRTSHHTSPRSGSGEVSTRGSTLAGGWRGSMRMQHATRLRSTNNCSCDQRRPVRAAPQNTHATACYFFSIAQRGGAISLRSHSRDLT